MKAEQLAYLGRGVGRRQLPALSSTAHQMVYLRIERMRPSRMGMPPDPSCMALSSGNSWRMAVASWFFSAWVRSAGRSRN